MKIFLRITGKTTIVNTVTPSGEIIANFNEPPFWLTMWDSVAVFLKLPNKLTPAGNNFHKGSYWNAYLFKSKEALEKEKKRRGEK